VSRPIVSSIPLPQFPLWDKAKSERILTSFALEVTARCNNDCRHCYINLPAGDRAARAGELALEEIQEIADQAVSLGALWCLITGGEPLLREDFPDLYLYLKGKGLLVSVFTNATLVTAQHVRLFQAYPPRDIEVTVYGATESTYERVTRRPGSYAAFRRGLDLLLDGGVRVRLKAMALRSNVAELAEIARFCRERTADYYRFDPVLHLRFDGDPDRNQEIVAERLTPDEIVALERSDPERFHTLQKECDRLIMPALSHITCDHLFHCGAGNNSFALSHEGVLRLCSSLWHPDCVYDLKAGTLKDAWHRFVPQVRDLRSGRKEYLATCRTCPLRNLCMWCPAHAHLETGELDAPVDYFCQVAHARAAALCRVSGAGESLPPHYSEAEASRGSR
jgi:radical SAM protein with 4Fe4S-binding SPASM domain